MSPMTPIIVLIILMYAGMRRRYLKDKESTTRLMEEMEISVIVGNTIEEMDEFDSEYELKEVFEVAMEKLLPYRQHPQIDLHFKALNRELAARIFRSQLKHVRRTENKIIYN